VNYNWNWHIFFEPNPTGAGNYLDMLVSGLVLTIETALLAWAIALIFGTIIGILRTLPSKTASWIGFGYSRSASGCRRSRSIPVCHGACRTWCPT
jgi:glutamate/aspartate transport system permease protein